MWTNLDDSYNSFYGGIDSNGVKDRTRALSALMVNVAERQALDMACSNTIMDFAKPKSERLIFTEIEADMEPDTDAASQHTIAADSREEPDTTSDQFNLSAGEKTLAISFLNHYYNRLDNGEEERNDLYIKSVQVVSTSGETILNVDFKNENHADLRDRFNLQDGLRCGNFDNASFRFWNSECSLDLPLLVTTTGTYEVNVSSFGRQGGDELTKMKTFIDAVRAWANQDPLPDPWDGSLENITP